MKIPKIIHYVWLGNNQLDYLSSECIESWRKYFPDYEIFHWHENNIPSDIEYIKNALKHKKWSNISNYVRMHALYNYGGLYFDTDFEVIKQFDFVKDVTAFIGYENHEPAVNSAIMGSVKGHYFPKKCLEKLLFTYDGLEPSYLSGPGIATSVLKDLGLTEFGLTRVLDIDLLPIEYFYPYPWDKPFTFSCISRDTYGIHLWAKSWLNDDLKLEIENLKLAESTYLENDSSLRYHFLKIIKLLSKRFKIS